MRWIAWVGVIILSASKNAHAFDTPTHNEITQRITTACGYDAESGRLLNLGNLYADTWDPNNHGGEGQVPAAHADSETFPQTSQRIRKLLQKAACDLIACRRDDALEALGRTIHPVEDFFSHSNFVEIELHDKKCYELDFLKLPAAHPDAVCDPRTHLTQYAGVEGLTSGYFAANDLHWKPRGKCSHLELNKDSPHPGANDAADPALTARLHPIAKSRAIQGGVTYLRDEAEPKILSVVRKLGRSLAGHATAPGQNCPGEPGAPVVGDGFVNDVLSAKFLVYLHSGGACPSAPLNPAVVPCPDIDW